MRFLSALDPLNTHLVWGVLGVLLLAGAVMARKARAAKLSPPMQRWGTWVLTAAVTATGLGLLAVPWTVSANDVGIGAKATYEVGTYLWPPERFVSINRAGSFLVPYPNDRVMVLVEYRIKDPAKLKPLYEELLSSRAALGKEHFLSSAGVDLSWRHRDDPFASWLQAKVRERLPTNPTGGEGYVQYSLEPVMAALIESGVSARLSLVRKDLLRSV